MTNTCKIVMYHYVRPILNSQYPEIRGLEIDGFLRQINFFKKKFHILTVTEFIDSLTNHGTIGKNSLLLTFDDGLRDHFLHVFPILKKNGLQGLFFVPSKPIVDKTILDVHKIHFILAKTDAKLILKEINNRIDEEKNKYGLASSEEYYSRLAKSNRFDSAETIFIKRILHRELPLELREAIVDELFRKYVTEDIDSFWKELYLSKDEIDEMSEAGMYFGSHGHSHEWYTRISKTQLKNELWKSFNFCSEINLTENRLIFCYPYGNYDQKVVEGVRDIGYIASLTTRKGDAILNPENAFELQRYDTNDFPQ